MRKIFAFALATKGMKRPKFIIQSCELTERQKLPKDKEPGELYYEDIVLTIRMKSSGNTSVIPDVKINLQVMEKLEEIS